MLKLKKIYCEKLYFFCDRNTNVYLELFCKILFDFVLDGQKYDCFKWLKTEQSVKKYYNN